MADYPDAFTNAQDDSVPGAGDGTPIMAKHLNNLEIKIGLNSSEVVGSIDYLLKNSASEDPGHKHTPPSGGTGIYSYTVGDLLYASAADALSKLPAAAVGQVLVSGGVGAAFAWSASPVLTTSLTVPTIIAPAASLILKPTTDGVTAIQLCDKDGNAILNVDTTNDRIGIGTTNPLSKLNINGGTGTLSTGLTFGDGDSGIYEATDDRLTIFSATDRIDITANTTTLQIGNGAGYWLWSPGQGTNRACVRNTEPSATTPAYVFASDPDTGIGSAGADILSLIAGGTNVLNVTAGNVGIGTTSFGTSAAKVLGMASGTAPTTAPADMAQMWVEDINGAAGYAGLHKRTETTNQKEVVPGVIIKTDTGSPANPYEGLLEINTFDNQFRGYAEAAWRTLARWDYTVGDLLYASAAGTLSKLAAVAVGQVLVSGGVGTAPAWSNIINVNEIILAAPAVAYLTYSTAAGGSFSIYSQKTGVETDVFTLDSDGAAWFIGNVSALSFTDRTPFYAGDALAEIKAIKGKAGKIDHKTLPAFASVKKTVPVYEGKVKVGERVEEGRDLGAMISMLTVAVQQLATRLELLEAPK